MMTMTPQETWKAYVTEAQKRALEEIEIRNEVLSVRAHKKYLTVFTIDDRAWILPNGKVEWRSLLR